MGRRYRLSEPKYLYPDAVHHLVAVDLGKYKIGVTVFLVDPAARSSKMVKSVTVHLRGNPHQVAAAVLRACPENKDTEAGIYWVCEWPKKYKRLRGKHKDIQSLHDVGNAIDRLIGGWDEKYLPGAWKGNVSKAPHHRRVARALHLEEYERMPGGSEHDAWDSCGIGLYALGRTRRGGKVVDTDNGFKREMR